MLIKLIRWIFDFNEISLILKSIKILILNLIVLPFTLYLCLFTQYYHGIFVDIGHIMGIIFIIIQIISALISVSVLFVEAME
jgi:hypothetical protein